jgi:hypothetical protein
MSVSAAIGALAALFLAPCFAGALRMESGFTRALPGGLFRLLS